MLSHIKKLPLILLSVISLAVSTVQADLYQISSYQWRLLKQSAQQLQTRDPDTVLKAFLSSNSFGEFQNSIKNRVTTQAELIGLMRKYRDTCETHLQRISTQTKKAAAHAVEKAAKDILAERNAHDASEKISEAYCQQRFAERFDALTHDVKTVFVLNALHELAQQDGLFDPSISGQNSSPSLVRARENYLSLSFLTSLALESTQTDEFYSAIIDEFKQVSKNLFYSYSSTLKDKMVDVKDKVVDALF